jgi:hypothetical protein
MLYSKNGSIPKPETDGTEGWVEVQEPPIAPDGNHEVVWWCPPGWVVRPIKPVKEGFDYSWSQSEEQWVEYELPVDTITLTTVEPTISLDLGSAADSITAGTATDTIISFDVGAAQEVITLASAEPTITIDTSTGA